ncbi:MAG: ROK family protein [Microbacterium sp.]|uniref:ROK family protein n=1 Tax=Microbacterium sp. TaxID=51671 RepID=UPI0039E4C418
MNDSTPRPTVRSRRAALALDIGGTKVESALVDSRGRLLPGTRHRAETGRVRTARQLDDAVATVARAALTAAADSTEVVGVGIGSAGPIDVARGTVSPINLPQWRNHPIVDVVRRATGLEQACLRHDGLCITLAENWIGALAACRDAMAIVVSTGVGGGLLIDGRLHAGRTGNAGHIGQIQIRERADSGPDAAATLEGIAAGPRAVAWARRHGWEGTSGEALVAAMLEGEPVPSAAIARSVNAVAEAIVNAGALLDLEAVAIGGGFANAIPGFADRVAMVLADAAPFETLRGIAVVSSTLADSGPLIGAAGLVLEPHRVIATERAVRWL